MRFRLEVEGQVHAVDLEPAGSGWTVAIGGHRWQVDMRASGHAWSLLLKTGEPGTHAGARSHDVWDYVAHSDHLYSTSGSDPLGLELEALGPPNYHTRAFGLFN